MAGRWQPDGSWLPGMPSGGGSSLSARRAWSPVPRLFWPGQYRVAPAIGRGLEAGDGAEAERLDYPQGADVERGDGDPERGSGYPGAGGQPPAKDGDNRTCRRYILMYSGRSGSAPPARFRASD